MFEHDITLQFLPSDSPERDCLYLGGWLYTPNNLEVANH